MKRPAGLVLFTALFFLAGMRVLSGASVKSDSPGASLLQLALAVLSLAVAYALWTRRGDAMKVYWTWLCAWLIGCGVAQSMYQDVPLLHVVIWWAAVAPIYGAIGLYLKGVVKMQPRRR